MDRSGLAGKHVVVTGCARGIGAATVHQLLELGAEVTGIDRDAAVEVAPTRLVVGDLSTRAGVEAVAAQVEGPVHALINNAGVAATLPWRTVLAVNALAPRDLTRALLPRLAPGAAVVTTASQAGFRWREDFARLDAFLAIEDWDEALAALAGYPDIESACYTVSKQAAIINAGNLAVDGKSLGLRSNSVSPGTVSTPLLPDFTTSMGAAAIEGAARWSGRHAQPDEVAHVLVFLVSAQASWLSGADIPVDGGFGALVFRQLAAATTATPAGR